MKAFGKGLGVKRKKGGMHMQPVLKTKKGNVLYKNEEGNFVVIGDENNAANVVGSLLAAVRNGTVIDSIVAADVIIGLILHEFKVVKSC